VGDVNRAITLLKKQGQSKFLAQSPMQNGKSATCSSNPFAPKLADNLTVVRGGREPSVSLEEKI
jgi:hypothetical protein